MIHCIISSSQTDLVAPHKTKKDTTYSFPFEIPSEYHTCADTEITMTPVASSSSAGLKNSGQSHSSTISKGLRIRAITRSIIIPKLTISFNCVCFFGHIIINNGSDNVVSQNIILIAGTLIHLSGHPPLPVIMTFNPMLACRRVCAYP